MGSGPSTINAEKGLRRGENEIVKLMFPLYYSSQDIQSDEHRMATDSWNSILNSTSEEYKRRKINDPEFHYSSCVIFFYDSFYSRLFDIHPMARSLFKNGMKSQGKFLVKMITLALTEINDPDKFDKTLIKLAEVHNIRGVKAVEYGVVGEVLFWCLKRVTGEAAYHSRVHMAWVKVYSRMLRIIVPTAVSLELQTNSEWQTKRLNDTESYMFSESRSQGATVASKGEDLDCEKIRQAEAVN